MTDTITAETLAGLSKADIIQILLAAGDEETETTEPTPKEQAEALVEGGGYSYAKGRVYLNADLIETAARIQNGGDPQIVSGSDEKRFCVLYRAENGDVVIQNLYKES